MNLDPRAVAHWERERARIRRDAENGAGVWAEINARAARLNREAALAQIASAERCALADVGRALATAQSRERDRLARDARKIIEDAMAQRAPFREQVDVD